MTWDTMTIAMRVFEVAKLLADGQSFAGIAKSFAVSKNAIAGTVFRHRDAIDSVVAALRRGDAIEPPSLGKAKTKANRRRNLTLVRAEAGECRFPLWTGRAPLPKQQFVCGKAGSDDKRVYCDEHHDLCHAAVRPPRVVQPAWMTNPPKKGIGMSLTDRAFGLTV